MSKTKETFLWGAATSSHQIEGYCENNDWYRWEMDGRIEGGTHCGKATDHWNRRDSDIALAAELGLNTYRFSIEWSKVEPIEGQWNEEAFNWYESLITACEKAKLIPLVTLHHFTSPLWFADQGGFYDEDAPVRFNRFVEKIVQRLGARLPYWCTLNEPMVLLLGGYIGKFMPPGVFEPKKIPIIFENLLDCHLKAYNSIHSLRQEDRSGPFSHLPISVGIAHNTVDFVPDRKWHPIEVVTAKVISDFYNWSFVEALMGTKKEIGIPGLIPKHRFHLNLLNKKSLDYLGINYYTRGYVQWNPRDSSGESIPEMPLGISFARRKEPQSDLGWSICPDGFRRILRKALKFGPPILITENGIADRDDKLRSQYIYKHLEVIAKLIEEGADIRGYYHWSLLDNFEWIKGFWPRFGLYRVNYNNFERTKTKSASMYESLIRAHQGQFPQLSKLRKLNKPELDL